MPDATAAPSPSTATQRGALHLLISTLLTYVRRPWLWSWPLATTLFAAFLSSKISPMYNVSFDGVRFDISDAPDGLFFSAFLLACSAGFFAASVTGHFAQLLTPPRGQVVPRLRRAALSANILLTAVIVLGAAVIWPHPHVTFVDQAHNGVNVVPVPAHALALAAVLAAQLAWTQVAPVTGALSLFAWGVLSFPTARDAVIFMLLGRAPVLEGTLTALAVILFLSLWITIARRRDRSYQVDPILEALLRRFGRAEPRIPAPAPPSARTIPALAPPRVQSARTRLRLHRRAAAAGVPATASGLLIGGLLLLWIISFRFFGIGEPDPMTPRLLCFMASILPVVLVTTAAMENRGPLLIHGLLLPMPRSRLVRELGLALLANLFTSWTLAVLPVLAWAACFTPPRVRPTSAAIIAMLAISAAYQLFAFGVVTWILRLTHRLAITLALAAVCTAGVVLMIDATLAYAPATLAVTAILALAGLALTLTAYARWAHAELPSAGPSKTAAAL